MCILDFFNMKTLLQLLLALKLISNKCVQFKNNLLPSDTVPLSFLKLLINILVNANLNYFLRISHPNYYLQ